jgi:ABC-type proline/glycine betaine transport system permease subunit
MESIMLTVKFALFLAMEVFVVATLVGALILGLYQVVRDKVRESRRLDEVVPETLPTTPTAS